MRVPGIVVSIEISYDKYILFIVCAEEEVAVRGVSGWAGRGGRDVDINDLQFSVVCAD